MNLKDIFDQLFADMEETTNKHCVVLTNHIKPLAWIEKRFEILELWKSHIHELPKNKSKTYQLETADVQPCFFFRNRETQMCYSGFGISDIIIPKKKEGFLDLIQQRSQQISEQYSCILPYFASIAFHNTRDYHWGCFPSQSFVMPIFLLVFDEKQQTQHILYIPKRDDIHQHHVFINKKFIPPSTVQNPKKQQFLTNFQTAQSFLQKHKKLVLALQKPIVSSKNPIDALQDISQQQENNFQFFYQFNDQASFLGCTPELLCHLEKKQRTYTISSEALAGTITRGINELEDREKEHQLRNSQKDRLEHQIVVDGILEVLESYCCNIQYESQPSIKKQQHVQHLQTRIQADILHCTHSDIEDLIFEIHPTPAVCGYPKTSAMDVIMEIEDFDRGFYAGAIGIISHSEITLCVGIRSALYHKNQYWLWGGAGLVQNSEANKEYQEMNNKIQGFEMILRSYHTTETTENTENTENNAQHHVQEISDTRNMMHHRYTF